MQTQIWRHRTRSLIRVSATYFQHILSIFELMKKYHSTTLKDHGQLIIYLHVPHIKICWPLQKSADLNLYLRIVWSKDYIKSSLIYLDLHFIQERTQTDLPGKCLISTSSAKAPFSLSRFKMPVHPGLMIRDEP